MCHIDHIVIVICITPDLWLCVASEPYERSAVAVVEHPVRMFHVQFRLISYHERRDPDTCFESRFSDQLCSSGETVRISIRCEPVSDMRGVSGIYLYVVESGISFFNAADKVCQDS